MKVVDFKVPQTATEAFRLQHDRLRYFYDRLHHHTEWQLMHILRGHGTLVAGDYVGRFEEDDLYLIASGQTHVFRCDDQFYEAGSECESVSVYFNEDYLGRHFWELSEMREASQWLEQSRMGLRILGATQEQVKSFLTALRNLEGIPRLIQFFTIIDLLIQSSETVSLSSTSFSENNGKKGKRMNDVLQFTFRESHRKIYLEEVARVANLSVEAFCRYFKLSTGKNYSTFLNDLRVSKACKLLAQQELSVQQVCFDAGFNNLSNFNRIFKRTTGSRPSQYAKMTRLRRSSAQG